MIVSISKAERRRVRPAGAKPPPARGSADVGTAFGARKQALIQPCFERYQKVVPKFAEKNKIDFTAVFSVTKGDILPGGYKLITGMTVENIAKILHDPMKLHLSTAMPTR